MRVFRRLIGGVRGDSGQALIEFALSSMLFFLLIFGIVEFGRAVYHYNVLATIAREGARFAIVRGTDSGRTTDEAAVRTFVRSRAVGFTPTVNVSWSPDKKPGSTVLVQVEATFTSVVSFLPIGSVAMTASSRMTILR